MAKTAQSMQEYVNSQNKKNPPKKQQQQPWNKQENMLIQISIF